MLSLRGWTWLVAFFVLVTCLRPAVTQELPAEQPSEVDAIFSAIAEETSPEKSPLSPTQLAAANEISSRISAAEWLGPLAPVALSPFFGITCLSLLAIAGPEWLPGKNGLLASPVLQNPVVFWSFLVLTILTSVPRLTKVSKPLGQAVDRIEAYASIITLIVIRFLAASPAGTDQVAGIDGAEPILVAGLFSVSADVLLSFAAAINVLVINSIKFFFEMLIWITPVPMIDALFEACNKTLCGVLIAIYAYSPMIATGINLMLLVVCSVMFRWVYRRVRFYCTLITEPIWRTLFGRSPPKSITVFPSEAYGPFPAKVTVYLTRDADGWNLVWWRWPLPGKQLRLASGECRLLVHPGWLSHSIEIHGETVGRFTTSRCSEEQLQELCRLFAFEMVKQEVMERSSMKAEFA